MQYQVWSIRPDNTKYLRGYITIDPNLVCDDLIDYLVNAGLINKDYKHLFEAEDISSTLIDIQYKYKNKSLYNLLMVQ